MLVTAVIAGRPYYFAFVCVEFGRSRFCAHHKDFQTAEMALTVTGGKSAGD